MVEIRELKKRYGEVVALAGVDLDIRPGEIFGLLGPNGAGKTTLISIVAGLVRATFGEARVLGRDVVKDYAFTRRVVGLVPQELNFDPFFTVEESLRFQAGYFGVRLEEKRLKEILENLELLEKRGANTRGLSGGMKRRLLIAKALVHEPRVLFLDEPTAGVDVELRRALWRYVRSLRDRGTTVVLTTHYLEEAEELADRIGVIDRGRLLLVEDTAALLERHGARRLRLRTDRRLASVPAPLALLGARLEEDGAIVLEVKAGGTFGSALAAAAAAGVSVKDLETHQTTLEDVFVRLVQARPGAPGAAAGEGP